MFVSIESVSSFCFWSVCSVVLSFLVCFVGIDILMMFVNVLVSLVRELFF